MSAPERTPEPAAAGTPFPVVEEGAGGVPGILRRRRWMVAYFCYATATAVSLLAAFVVRFELQIPLAYLEAVPLYLAALLGLRMAAARLFHLLDGRWRFVGVDDALRLVAAATVSSATFLALFVVMPWVPPPPRSVVALEWAFFTLGVGGVWLLYRRTVEHLARRRHGGRRPGKRVVLVGAGDSGNLLAREMSWGTSERRLVGFLDDDPLKWGTRIQGARVLGGTERAAELLEGLEVDEVIVSAPSATPAELRRILGRFDAVDVPLKVLPGIRQALASDVRMERVRPLRMEDLLGREPVTLEIPELEAYLEGRTVLVTGAAGSIGSELARQIAANRPGRLVLLDQAESDLYHLDLEMRAAHPGLDLACVVADVLDRKRVRDVFARERPHAVFHAAAYKHVPLMEANPREAVRTNALGTWHVARAAVRQGVDRFVLVSTDKAADPSSVMGGSKRAAELLLQEVQRRAPDTHLTAVRFGNVLGSNGSVVPLFRRQIQGGGPVTVTHPEVTRYFMTVSEAVRLVLRAALLDEAWGRILMLEMGEPVRIVDLARTLIRLAGKRPGVDVPITYIGMRPGEKLHETLVGERETVEATGLSGVYLLRTGEAGERAVPPRKFLELIMDGNGEDGAALRALKLLLPELELAPERRAAAGAGSGARRGAPRSAAVRAPAGVRSRGGGP